MSISEKLQSLLNTFGWSKSEFAMKIGVSQAYVSQLCNGQRQPSMKIIDRICDAFGIEKEELFSAEGLSSHDLINVQLTSDEYVLLQKFRLLSGHDQQTIKSLLNVMPVAQKTTLLASTSGDNESKNA